MSDIEVREAKEEDVPLIRQLFIQTYGPNYSYQEFYDDYWLKKTVYSDNYLFLVAEKDKEIAGTASIYYDFGSYTDLTGEFGRLVVDEAYRGQGIGSLLMHHRIRFARQRLHFGMSQTRTTHPYAQRISKASGFQPVGYSPLGTMFSERESLGVWGQIFNPVALELRRSNPRIIPEVFPLAAKVLSSLNFPNDLMVIEDAECYPMHDEFAVEELAETGLPHLLRIERGRLKKRQVFGSLMLSYGYFALQAKEARYLVAKQGEHIVGAIGYLYDYVDRTVKILELIDLDDAVAGFLLRELDRRAREEMDVAFAEVFVSAYWPRIQRTLDQLGFCPVAYCPSYVFRGMERLDVVRMGKLYVPYEENKEQVLIPEIEAIADLVIPEFKVKGKGIQIDEFTRSVSLFKGLIDAQMRSLAAVCELAHFKAGDIVFKEGTINRNLYMILKGEVDIFMGVDHVMVGRVFTGDVLGEISLVEGMPHSATAVVARDSDVIVLSHQNYESLIRRYPRIGLTVMHNIARSLGNKLKSMDITVMQLYGQANS